MSFNFGRYLSFLALELKVSKVGAIEPFHGALTFDKIV
jgi:hypothetical protein